MFVKAMEKYGILPTNMKKVEESNLQSLINGDMEFHNDNIIIYTIFVGDYLYQDITDDIDHHLPFFNIYT